jgi:hypothetical protein
MALSSGPNAGEPVDELWRHVRELKQAVAALQNMTVQVGALIVEGKTGPQNTDGTLQVNAQGRGSGRLLVSENDSKLVIE